MSSRTAHRCVRTVGLAAIALALPALPAFASTSAGAAQAPTPAVVQKRASDAPITLWAPAKIETTSYKGRAYTDLGLKILAHGAPFELWSTRADYDSPIKTVWRSPDGDPDHDVAFPDGSMSAFTGLRHFLKVDITRVSTGETQKLVIGTCLAGYAERVVPDAPATSDYPRSCYFNPYALGSVQGIQDGWATPAISTFRPLKVSAGRYQVTARISAPYAARLGLTTAEATRKIALVVTNDTYGQERGAGRTPGPTSGPTSGLPAQPAAHRPTGPTQIAPPPATQPDLRSLPAWGIGMARNGKYLQFSATVWNAGNSPLVVDGFRVRGEDEMEAYQYFFDGDGTQTGYQKVGHMHWDAKPTHQHWHFKDFATYTLLKADKTAVVKSRKEAFCLANTDAVDLTVPEAVWNPDGTDLATACGEYGSLSIREVLASGWGDTYAQFRAGQSFNLDGLANGTYFIEVRANPNNRLVEASTSNNVALRKIILGGKPGARTVKVPQVGVITEPKQGGSY